jgi:hypothetical protein
MEAFDLLNSFGEGSAGRRLQALIDGEGRQVGDTALWRPGAEAFRLVGAIVFPPPDGGHGTSELRLRMLIGVLQDEVLPQVAARLAGEDQGALALGPGDFPSSVLKLLDRLDACTIPSTADSGSRIALRLAAAAAVLIRIEQAVLASDRSIEGLAQQVKRGLLPGLSLPQIHLEIGALEQRIRADAPLGALLERMQVAVKQRAQAGGNARAAGFSRMKAFIEAEWAHHGNGYPSKADFARIYARRLQNEFQDSVDPRTIVAWLKGR